MTRGMRLWLLACLTVLVVCAVVLTVRTTTGRDEKATKQDQYLCGVEQRLQSTLGRAGHSSC